MVTDPTWIWRDCEHCGTPFGQPDDPGRKRRFCSGACRTGAYRARKRRQEQQQRQRHQDDARRRAYEDTGRRQRARSHQPPPHAGTSRPGTWCGPCGGTRGPHTYHHDDAAHARARRRYESLRAKAASTSFPHEADACRAKAEALRDKYGL
jgi:Protein of unknown function (DUF2786)